MLTDWIADKYGSKKGLLRFWHFNMRALLGAYKSQNRSSQPFKRLVFLCSGNICRSPYGEVVARSLGIDTISFGLHCRGGGPPMSEPLHMQIREDWTCPITVPNISVNTSRKAMTSCW